MNKLERKQISEDRAIGLGTDEVWENDMYNVIVYRDPSKAPELPQTDAWPKMIWLSIKRLDREAVHDWRDMQEIKNQIVGEENEALEIYPAESRLVDTSNQFHLWVFEDPTVKLPFGFQERGIANEEQAKLYGAKQRPFKK